MVTLIKGEDKVNALVWSGLTKYVSDDQVLDIARVYSDKIRK